MRKLKSIKALAYSILATLVILSSTLVASAQLPQCEVSGTIYRGDGSPAVSIPVTIVKVVKAGSLISTRSITLRSGVDGSITLTLPRESTAYIYADARGLNNNGPAGVPLPIPNSDTASLESLVSIGSIPVNGITVIDSSDVTLSNVIGTFKFGSGLSITHSPTGQVNISSTAAFSVREVDTSPSVSSPPIIEFDQADGFVVSNSSSNARIDLAGIPVNKLAALTPSRVVVTDGSGFIVDSAVAASDIQNALKLRSVDIASTTPTNGKVLKYNSSNSSWEPADDNDSGGTVTSVNATVPAELSVSGVPITGAGTIAIAWNSASGRKFIASPNDGSSGAYAGRAIVIDDIPDLSSLYQPLDAQLTDIAGLSITNGNTIRADGLNWLAIKNNIAATTAPTANDDSGDGYAVGSRWLDVSNDKEYVATDVTLTAAVWVETTGAATVWGGITGTLSDQTDLQVTLDGKQPVDAELTALAGLTSATDRVPYFTGSGTASLATFTSYGRSVVAVADEAAFKSLVNLEAGVDYQAFDAELTALAGLTSAADKLPYFTGSGTASVADFTPFGRSLVDDANAAAGRTTLDAAQNALVTFTGPTVARSYALPDAAATLARTDAGQTFTGNQVFSGILSMNAATLTGAGAGDIVVGGGGVGLLAVNQAGSGTGYLIRKHPSNDNTLIASLNGTARLGDQLTFVGSGTGKEIRTESDNTGFLDIRGGLANTGGRIVLYGTSHANAGQINLVPGATKYVNISISDAGTATIVNPLLLDHTSSGTPAGGFGTGLLFQGKSSTTSNQDMAQIASVWTTATHASRTSDLVFYTVNSTTTGEAGRFTGAGNLITTGYTITDAIALNTSAAPTATLDIALTAPASNSVILKSAYVNSGNNQNQGGAWNLSFVDSGNITSGASHLRQWIAINSEMSGDITSVLSPVEEFYALVIGQLTSPTLTADDVSIESVVSTITNAWGGSIVGTPNTIFLGALSVATSGDLGTSGNTLKETFKATATGTADNNYAAVFSATGATDNYAIRIDAGDIRIEAGATDIILSASSGMLNITSGGFQVGGVDVPTISSTSTLTGKTIDPEATGNVIGHVAKIWLEGAGIDGSTAFPSWDTDTTAAPTATQATGSNVTNRATLDFADGATEQYVYRTFILPADVNLSAGLDIKIVWYANDTTGDAKWEVASSCAASGEAFDQAFNTGSTVTTTTSGTANRLNHSSVTGLIITGCAANELLTLRLKRLSNDVADTLTVDAKLVGVEITARRSQ